MCTGHNSIDLGSMDQWSWWVVGTSLTFWRRCGCIHDVSMQQAQNWNNANIWGPKQSFTQKTPMKMCNWRDSDIQEPWSGPTLKLSDILGMTRDIFVFITKLCTGYVTMSCLLHSLSICHPSPKPHGVVPAHRALQTLKSLSVTNMYERASLDIVRSSCVRTSCVFAKACWDVI